MAGNDETNDSGRAPRAARWAGEATLSVERAFVVHFSNAGGPGLHRFSGRVEHLPSGETADFSSLKGLLAFFVDVLDASQPDGRSVKPSSSCDARESVHAPRKGERR